MCVCEIHSVLENLIKSVSGSFSFENLLEDLQYMLRIIYIQLPAYSSSVLIDKVLFFELEKLRT